MRALVLLLLCVMLLAVLQASYIVADAKKHDEMKMMEKDETDTAARQLSKHERKMRRKQRKEEAAKDLEEAAEGAYPEEQELTEVDPTIPRDQPASERGGRRERVSKDERRERKQQRKERKEQRKERKEQRQNKKEGKNDKKDDKKGKKKDKAEKKAARKQKKAERQEKRANRQQNKVTCTSEADCGEDECCVPKHSGEMLCKPNRKPRKAGKKCVTSCACEGDLQCYAETPAPDAPKRPKRHVGTCVAGSEADLTKGSILTAESRAEPTL